MGVTVDLPIPAVLVMISVVIDGSADGVVNTVTVGTGAVTVCMLGLSCERSPIMAEIAAMEDELMVDKGEAVTVIVTGRSIVDVIVLGSGWLAVTWRLVSKCLV